MAPTRTTSTTLPAVPPKPAAPSGTDHRQRVLDGMADALMHQPYGEITIADIVARARVSKRTFYEQFPGKEACLLALCEQMSERTLAVIAANYRFDENWVDQVRHVTQAYLRSLAERPTLIKALYVELLTLGPAGMALRRSMSQRFAAFLLMQVEAFRAKEPRKRPMSPALATAVVGGINELILQAIELDQADRLADLSPTITAFVEAVIRSLDPLNDPA